MSLAMRWTNTAVLPVPAPARTITGPATWSMAACWLGSGWNAGALRETAIDEEHSRVGCGKNKLTTETRRHGDGQIWTFNSVVFCGRPRADAIKQKNATTEDTELYRGAPRERFNARESTLQWRPQRWQRSRRAGWCCPMTPIPTPARETR